MQAFGRQAQPVVGVAVGRGETDCDLRMGVVVGEHWALIDDQSRNDSLLTATSHFQLGATAAEKAVRIPCWLKNTKFKKMW